ncbi:MAG: molybdate ABC transporter substrate-binding protein [Pseudomonadota bacterium]
MTPRPLIVAVLLCFSALPSQAEDITVAVASNFTSAMRDIVTEFEQASEHRVKLAFGASGKFYAQIKHGAPFQVFFSADQAKPMALEKEGLIVPGSRFTYAIGTLALWSSRADFIDAEATVLKEGNFNKLAIANPKLAPYGAAAIDVLRHLSLEKTTRRQWVQGENIAQTYQFVSTGNADLGFVSLSQLLDQGRIKTGSAWVAPKSMHRPIRQDAVLLKRGEDSLAAHELIRFMRSDKAISIIAAYGYQHEDALVD